jgi:hypothetical protein
MACEAQKFLVKQGVNKLEGAYRTQDDMFNASLLGASTNASKDVDPTRYESMSKSQRKLSNVFLFVAKSVADGDAFKLPSILQCSNKGNTSPFKGFLDVSIVNQKLRKTLNSQDGRMG